MYNKSHCKDPTAGQAVANIRKTERKKEKKVVSKLLQYPSYQIALKEAQNTLLEAIREKERYISGLNSPSLEEPSVSSNTSDPTYVRAQKAIQLYDKRIAKAEENIKAFRAWVEAVDSALLQLSGTERYIIKERYMQPGKPTPYADIGAKLNYSEGHCKKLKNIAISKLSRLL